MKNIQFISLCLTGLVLVIVSVLLVLQTGVTGALRRELNEANLIIEDYRERVLGMTMLENRIEALTDMNQYTLLMIQELERDIELLLGGNMVMVRPTEVEIIFPTTRTVMPGDSLAAMIERVYGFVNSEMVHWIADLNNLRNPNHLTVGQEIHFPSPSEFEYTVFTTPYPYFRRVEYGDNLASMIERVYGHVDDELIGFILMANNLLDPNRLFVGQYISFPPLYMLNVLGAREIHFPTTRYVALGDGLMSMMMGVYGFAGSDMVEWIARVNDIDPMGLYVGQIIIFPCLTEFYY